MPTAKETIAKLSKLRDDLFAKMAALYKVTNNGVTGEIIEVGDSWGKIKDFVYEIESLDSAIRTNQTGLKNGDIPEFSRQGVEEQTARDIAKLEKRLKYAPRLEKAHRPSLDITIPEDKIRKPTPEQKEETKKEEVKAKEVEKIAEKKTREIEKTMEKSVEKFNARGSAIDKEIYKSLVEEIGKLETADGKIKNTVANLRRLNSIKNRLSKIILSDAYMSDLKDYIGSFNEVTKLQNQYWKIIDKDFKAGPYLKEIRRQVITDTVNLLSETGVAGNAITGIANILQQNITSGGSIAEMAEALRQNIVTDSTFSRSAKQVTTDAINQYNAQYTQVVSSDLGFEWYAYRNSNIKTTRGFCFAMTELRYFHVTEIPRLLRAEDLYYTDPKTKQRKKVQIYARTGLPEGMIAGTNASNFTTLRGGYNCGHQIQPVPQRNVPVQRIAEVQSTPAYQAWKSAQG